MLSEEDAAAVVRNATRTEWDKQFLKDARVLAWVTKEVQTNPFDPDRTPLINYVRERMEATQQEQERQKQQQEEQQQQQPVQAFQKAPLTSQTPPASTSSTQPLQQKPSTSYSTSSLSVSSNPPQKAPSPSLQHRQTTSDYAFLDDGANGQDEDNEAIDISDDEPMQFGFDDFTTTTNEDDMDGLGPISIDRSPSPAIIPNAPTTATSAGHFGMLNGHATATAQFPFAQPSSSTMHGTSQPFLQAQQSSNPQLHRYHTESLPEQPSVMNPAFLMHNNAQHNHQQANFSSISPAQLSQQPQLQQQYLQSYQPQPQMNGFINPSQATLQNRPRQSVEVVIPIAVKRESTPQSTSTPALKKAKVATATASPPIQKRPTPPPAAPAAPLTESEIVWKGISANVKKQLNMANDAPISTVSKLMKVMASYLSEKQIQKDEDGNTKEVTVSELSVPPEGRIEILRTLKEKTQNGFDQCFIADKRALALINEWSKDLSLIGKGRDSKTGFDPVKLKGTARILMEVIQKLPVDLRTLRTQKGIGRYIKIISESDVFDEVTKDIAAQLVKKWTRMAQTSQAKSKPVPAKPAPPPAAPAPRKRVERTPPAPETDARKKRKISPPEGETAQPGQTATPAPAKVIPTLTKPLPKANVNAATGKVLPSFAKRKPAPSAAPKASTTPVPKPAPAPTVPFDPFATALQDMNREKEAVNGMSMGETMNMLKTAFSSAGEGQFVPKAGKKRKSVRWETDDNLKKVKIVPVLVYGDEFGNEIADSEYFNTTGEIGSGDAVAEAAAMKQLVELIEWEEPQSVDFNLPEEAISVLAVYPAQDSIGVGLLDTQKCERTNQEEREQNILPTTYLEDKDIPPNPVEPPSVVNEDTEEAKIRMKLSYTLENDQAVQILINEAEIARNGGISRPLEVKLSNPVSSDTQASVNPPPLLQQHVAPPGPALANAPQDLTALLAKLSDASAAGLAGLANQQIPQQPQQPVVQQTMPMFASNNNPVIPPSAPQGFQSMPSFNAPAYIPPPQPQYGAGWGAPPPIDYSNLGPLPADAYKRKKPNNRGNGPNGGKGSKKR